MPAETIIRVGYFFALIIHHTSYLPHTAQLCRAPHRFTELSHKAQLPVLQSRPLPTFTWEPAGAEPAEGITSRTLSAEMRSLDKMRPRRVPSSVIRQDLCIEPLLLQMKKSWSACFSSTGGFTPDRSCGASLSSMWRFRI